MTVSSLRRKKLMELIMNTNGDKQEMEDNVKAFARLIVHKKENTLAARPKARFSRRG